MRYYYYYMTDNGTSPQSLCFHLIRELILELTLSISILRAESVVWVIITYFFFRWLSASSLTVNSQAIKMQHSNFPTFCPRLTELSII